MIALLLAGCWLEKVSGEPVPLDPRFYEAVEKAQGAPGEGGGDAIPFHSWEGARVEISGEVKSATPDPVDIDVRTPDPTEAGGVKGHGKLMLDAPGPFSLSVPAGLGALELQAFQDLDADGPGGADPFAQVSFTVGDGPIEGVVLDLVAGARGTGPGGPVHQEMPPGAPGGGSPSGGAAGGSGEAFPSYTGPVVVVSGTLRMEGQATVDVDLFQPDPTSPGGRKLVAKVKRASGAWTLRLPARFGPVIIEAFVDLAGDGPGIGDPMGVCARNPLVVGDEDIDGVDVVLAVTADGKLPATPPPGQAPQEPPRAPK